MRHKLKITLCKNKINFHLLLEGKSLNRPHYTFSIDFCELVAFSLVSSKVLIRLAILVFYHLWVERLCIYLYGYSDTRVHAREKHRAEINLLENMP